MISPRFFQPRSIAVVGASRDRSKVGAQILGNLHHGFQGRLYPVNPHAKKILGYHVVPSVTALPESVDMAIVVVPAQFVLSVLEECGQKKIRHVVIISGGFGEQGSEGRAREEAVKRCAEKYNMTVLGPNCLGFLVPRLGINASFGPSLPPKGTTAFFSQSGAMAVALMDLAEQEGLGFSLVVSMGNKAVVSETDMLRYAAQDPHTKVIALYLESIEEGSAFFEVVREVSKIKPVILLKAGKTEAGSHAIASHTGKIAGDVRVFDAYAEDSGLIQVNSEEELLVAVRVLSAYTRVSGKRLGVVTNAGGPGVLFTDGLENTGMQMMRPSKKLKTMLRSVLPAHVSVENPIDILGDASSEHYAQALRAVCVSGEVDMLVVLLTPQTATDVMGTAKVIGQLAKEFSEIPMFVSFLGGTRVQEGIAHLLRQGVVHCTSIAKVVLATRVLYAYTQGQQHRSGIRVTKLAKEVQIQKVLEKATSVLSITETHQVMKYLGASLLPMKKIMKKEDIRAIPKSYYPVVLKIDNTHVLHKTDIGGVVLGLENARVVEHAWNTLRKNVEVPYMIVEKMSQEEHVELFVGAKRTVYGDVLVVGMGGIYAELFSDHCLIPAPFTERRVAAFVRQMSFWKVITGARGRAYDEAAAVQTIALIGTLFATANTIEVMDVNPLFVYQKGAKCIDVKITVRG